MEFPESFYPEMQQGYLSFSARRIIAIGVGILLILFLSVIFSHSTPLEAAPSSINITASAVQTMYQTGVPHIDNNGNPRTTYDQNSSFFPNGIFWLSTDQMDTGAVPVLANAGFNLGMNIKGEDPQFFIDQINGNNQYAVGIANAIPFELLADATTTEANITIIDPDLVPGNTYLYFVCTPDCSQGMLVAQGTVTAEQGQDSQGSVTLSWDDGSNFKLLIDSRLALDENLNYDPTTFDETLFSNYQNNPKILGWWLADEPYKIARVVGNDPSINYDAVSQVYEGHKDQTNQVLFITEGYMEPTDETWDQFVNLGDLGNVYTSSLLKEMYRFFGG